MKTIKELETCNCQECKYKADLLKKVVGLIDERLTKLMALRKRYYDDIEADIPEITINIDEVVVCISELEELKKRITGGVK